MPSKNIRKDYTENTCYHVYNRGVEKRTIFQDEQDYKVFLGYLKDYLLPKNRDNLLHQLTLAQSWAEKSELLKMLRMNNFNGEITLLAFCLMPNHFHLLIHQKSSVGMDSFINSLGTRYTMYFNRKYHRVGNLYQSRYKAVAIDTDEQLLHLSRYIHKQALEIQKGQAFLERQPCSWGEYLGIRSSSWVQPNEVLSFFSKTNPLLSYKSFVTENEEYAGLLDGIMLEEE